MDYDFSKTKDIIKKNKLLFNVLKALIFLVSSYYLYLIFTQNYQQIKSLSLFNNRNIFIFVITSSVAYIFLLIILALGWKKIIELIEQRNISNQLVTIYLRSLIYKYIPGNIFHYANRQIVANQIGIKHLTLLKSNLYEAVFLISAALFFASVLIENWLQTYLNGNYYLLLSLFFISLLFLYFSRKSKVSQLIYLSMPYYLLYFLGIGLICYFAINNMTQTHATVLQCICLYSIAWIVGFIIPGAPGGIGVRESAFIFLSNGIINQSESIFVVSILRISTTLGEILVFLLTQFNHYSHQNDTSDL